MQKESQEGIEPASEKAVITTQPAAESSFSEVTPLLRGKLANVAGLPEVPKSKTAGFFQESLTKRKGGAALSAGGLGCLVPGFVFLLTTTNPPMASVAALLSLGFPSLLIGSELACSRGADKPCFSPRA